MAARRRRWLAAGLLLLLAAAGCAARRDTPAAALPCPSPAPTATATAQPSPSPTPSTTPVAVAARRRNVVLIGDSTTFGTPVAQSRTTDRVVLQSPYQPGATLEALLALEPTRSHGGTPWRGATVHNFALAATTTELWLTEPPRFCKKGYARVPVVAKACKNQIAWVKAVPLMVKPRIDAVIVDLGINDLLLWKDPRETVARLLQIRDALAPAPVIFFPPIAPPNGPRGTWPQEVRAEMIRQGLFAESQYPPYVPTYDDLHPTDGGYAAKAGLWLDALRKLP